MVCSPSILILLRRVRSFQRPFALELHLALWIAIVKQDPAA